MLQASINAYAELGIHFLPHCVPRRVNQIYKGRNNWLWDSSLQYFILFIVRLTWIVERISSCHWSAVPVAYRMLFALCRQVALFLFLTALPAVTSSGTATLAPSMGDGLWDIAWHGRYRRAQSTISLSYFRRPATPVFHRWVESSQPLECCVMSHCNGIVMTYN